MENRAHHFVRWAKTHDIDMLYIQPEKPAQNGYIERFNRSYREAVLDRYLFKDIQQAQQETNVWLQHYNEERPHESLHNKTPSQFAQENLRKLSNLAVG